MTRGISMWLSKRHSRRRQLKHIESELKMLRRERQQVEARGGYSARELAAKEAELADYDRRMQRLELEGDRLRLLEETGGDRECSGGEGGVVGLRGGGYGWPLSWDVDTSVKFAALKRSVPNPDQGACSAAARPWD